MNVRRRVRRLSLLAIMAALLSPLFAVLASGSAQAADSCAWKNQTVITCNNLDYTYDADRKEYRRDGSVSYVHDVAANFTSAKFMATRTVGNSTRTADEDVTLTNVAAKTGNPDDNNTNAGGTGANDDAALAPTCDVGALTWVFCPIISIVQKGVTFMEEQIAKQLTFAPVRSDAPVYKVWDSFRNLSNVFFILIFAATIFGTALGLDNYTVKKMLPRLVAAAILIQASFLLMGLAVDAANILGQGVNSIAATALPDNAPKTSSATTTVGWVEAAGIAGAGLFAAINLSLFVPILLVVGSALLSLLGVFLTLQLRQLLIQFCIIVAPLAILLWVLPNTEKYFSKWRNLLITLLLMYPIIMLLFAAADMFSVLIPAATPESNDTAGWTQKLMAAIIPILAFAAVPYTFKMAGGIFGMGLNAINRGGGLLDKRMKNSKAAKNALENRRVAGLKKVDALGAAGLGNGLQARLARSQAGFGTGRVKADSTLERQVVGATQKEMGEQAKIRAFKNYQNGENVRKDPNNFENAVASASEIEEHNLLMGGVNKAGFKWQSREADDAGFADARADISSGSTSQAEKIAAMQFLAKGGSKGRNHLRDVKAEFVAKGQLAGQAGMTAADLVTYRMGIDKVDGDKAPDLKKPVDSAFSGVSAMELANFDSRTTKVAVDHWNALADERSGLEVKRQSGFATAAELTRMSTIDKTLGQANGAIKALSEAPTLSAKIEPGSVEALYGEQKFISNDAKSALYGTFDADGSRGTRLQGQAAQAPTVISQNGGVKGRLMSAAKGNIEHAVQLHQEYENNPTFRTSVDQSFMTNQNIQATPYAPVSNPVMPERVGSQIMAQAGDDLDRVAAQHNSYKIDPGYRTQVDNAVKSGGSIPLPAGYVSPNAKPQAQSQNVVTPLPQPAPAPAPAPPFNPANQRNPNAVSGSANFRPGSGGLWTPGGSGPGTRTSGPTPSVRLAPRQEDTVTEAPGDDRAID